MEIQVTTLRSTLSFRFKVWGEVRDRVCVTSATDDSYEMARLGNTEVEERPWDWSWKDSAPAV